MACIAGDVKIGPPAGCKLGGAFDAAIGIVGGRHQHRGESQRIGGQAAKRRGFDGDVRVLVDIGRCDEEGTFDLAVGLGLARGDNGQNAERMADKHNGPRGHHDLAFEGFEPTGEGGRVPLFLFHEFGVADLFDPAVLPVAGAGMAQPGNDQNVGVCSFHNTTTWEISGRCARGPLRRREGFNCCAPGHPADTGCQGVSVMFLLQRRGAKK